MKVSEACCTCATLLASIPPRYDEKTAERTTEERRLDCCQRAICAKCIRDNPRFATYCPYCQMTTTPSALPQGLRDPPAYSPPPSPTLEDQDEPPAYAEEAPTITAEKSAAAETKQAPDVLHFLDPNRDSVSSLSLRYGVPASALRRTNDLYADHLLAGRRTILIPGEYYKGGVSLSPRPVEGEEEEARKGKIRRWMVACKVAEYNVALLYLKQHDYDLDAAITAYKEDERWEQEHPLKFAGKGKARAKSRPFLELFGSRGTL